ncbi:hypothetical protein NQZ79_g6038 [Umbelopsis isabellina]|nr:hypothetical protein NQZ79_g6038 [Umbelopsis isabellina]
MSRQFGTNNVRALSPPHYRQFQNLHNRAALFGDRDDRPSSAASGRYTPTRFGALDSSQHDEGSYRVKMDDSELDYLESQNDDKIHGLSAKVAVLKNVSGKNETFVDLYITKYECNVVVSQITSKIGDEIQSGNSLLDTMNDQFSHTGTILGDTFSKFKVMAAKEGVILAYYLFFR